MQHFLIPTCADLGAVVRGVRKSRGLTQAQLAQRAGLLPKTISAIETGAGQVLVSSLMRCLSALGVDLQLAPRAGGLHPPKMLRRVLKSPGQPVPHRATGKLAKEAEGERRQAPVADKSGPLPRVPARAVKALKERW